MAEPVCDVIIRPTERTPHATIFVPGMMKSAHSFVDKPELALSGASHDRIHEWRELGYDVQVVSGDDPLELAKRAAKGEEPAAKTKAPKKSGEAAKEDA